MSRQRVSSPIVVALLVATAGSALAQTCPEPLASATRLVLITSEGMATAAARMQRFERATAAAAWQPTGGPQSALIGRNGMAWAQSFRSLAKAGEPIKVDGDKRAPAGIYRIGNSFGFDASSRPGYLRVQNGTVCVDDPASPAYNTISSRAKVGTNVHGENMRNIAAYRHGLLVDYPTDRVRRAGSCIFIHVRLPGATGTAGCVAIPEPDVIALQGFAEPGAVLAIFPEAAKGRLAGCLPAAN